MQQLSKEEYARKRIPNGSSVQIENSVTRVTVRHHSASLVMPNSYPRDGICNQHLTTIKDSYIFDCKQPNYFSKINQKAMIRNRYSWIPHTYLRHHTGKEHKQSRLHKENTAKAESQEVSFFPADVLQAILNQINN